MTDIATAAVDVKPETNTRDWKFFVDEINTIWRRGAADYRALGQLLIEARDELQSDTYSAMLKQLHFNTSTAKKLICIAKNPTLGSHVNQLPPNYSTLYELSQLDAETLLAALADGSIHPGMQRKDAVALKPKKKKTTTTNNITTTTMEPTVSSKATSLRAAWDSASEDERCEFLDGIGQAGFCAVMSTELSAEIRDHVISLTFAGSSQSSRFAEYATDKLHAALRCAEQPTPENTSLMIGMLGCILKKADVKNISHSNIVIAESKRKNWK